MISASCQDIVADGRAAPSIRRRPRLRGPVAAVIVIAAVAASGALLNRFDASFSQPAAADQPQPFDHFPR